jgi:hypothetical protein
MENDPYIQQYIHDVLNNLWLTDEEVKESLSILIHDPKDISKLLDKRTTNKGEKYIETS